MLSVLEIKLCFFTSKLAKGTLIYNSKQCVCHIFSHLRRGDFCLWLPNRHFPSHCIDCFFLKWLVLKNLPQIVVALFWRWSFLPIMSTKKALQLHSWLNGKWAFVSQQGQQNKEMSTQLRLFNFFLRLFNQISYWKLHSTWRTASSLALHLSLGLTSHGVFSLDISFDGWEIIGAAYFKKLTQ